MARLEKKPVENLRWFALRCAPQKEKLAVTILERLNFVAVTPTEPRLRKKTRFDKERNPIEYPVLPGCLFVGVEDKGHLFRVVNFHFINSVVGINGRYAEFDPRLLMPFLNFSPETSPQYYKYMRTKHEFDIGDTVRLRTGAFRDAEMKVADIKGREAFFLIPLLGREHRFAMSVDDCEKAA
jgi:transcription antitermination factor NusG